MPDQLKLVVISKRFVICFCPSTVSAFRLRTRPSCSLSSLSVMAIRPSVIIARLHDNPSIHQDVCSFSRQPIVKWKSIHLSRKTVSPSAPVHPSVDPPVRLPVRPSIRPLAFTRHLTRPSVHPPIRQSAGLQKSRASIAH